MAEYFVASGGSNTAPYDTWAKAATSLQTALTAATATNDIVVIQYDAVPTGDASLAADTNFTFAGNILLVSASNDGGSAWTPTPMGTANWIGHGTNSVSIGMEGAFRVAIYGLTMRIAGSTLKGMGLLAGADGGHSEWSNCYFWQGSSASNPNDAILIGSGGGNGQGYHRFKDCTVRFGNANNRLIIRSDVEFEGLVVSSAGTAVNSLMLASINGVNARFIGCDLTSAGATGLVSTSTFSSSTVVFDRCKLAATSPLLSTLAAPLNKSNAKVFAYDCANGDTHGLYAYQDAFGTMTLDTGIYKTGTPSLSSWKIVTTANCSRYTPFMSPWLHTYWDATAAITPRLEILRDGSATAYTDAEVWGEFMAKVTTTSTQATLFSDAALLNAAGTAQATGVGLGSWTGESGTAWSGKVDSGASLTPAESGDLSARVLVGLASATVYVNPQIETV